jgi:hypothetical protein
VRHKEIGGQKDDREYEKKKERGEVAQFITNHLSA